VQPRINDRFDRFWGFVAEMLRVSERLVYVGHLITLAHKRGGVFFSSRQAVTDKTG
jgi:hypothetical protein